MTDAAALFEERFHPSLAVTDLAARRTSRPLVVHGPAARCTKPGCKHQAATAIRYAARHDDPPVLVCPEHLEHALDAIGLRREGSVQIFRLGGEPS